MPHRLTWAPLRLSQILLMTGYPTMDLQAVNPGAEADPHFRCLRAEFLHQPHNAVLTFTAALLAFDAQQFQLAGDVMPSRDMVPISTAPPQESPDHPY